MIGIYPGLESVWAVALAMLMIVMAYGIHAERANARRRQACRCRIEGRPRHGQKAGHRHGL